MLKQCVTHWQYCAAGFQALGTWSIFFVHKAYLWFLIQSTRTIRNLKQSCQSKAWNAWFIKSLAIVSFNLIWLGSCFVLFSLKPLMQASFCVYTNLNWVRIAKSKCAARVNHYSNNPEKATWCVATKYRSGPRDSGILVRAVGSSKSASFWNLSMAVFGKPRLLWNHLYILKVQRDAKRQLC